MHVRQSRLLWALFAMIAAISAFLVLRRPAWERLSDLHIYYGAVQWVQGGQPLYSYVAENGGPFTYPPFALLMLWPIGLLPEPVVQLTWLLLVCAAVVVIALAFGGAIAKSPEKRGLVVAAAACALVISAPVQSNLRFGQVSIFIVLLALIDGLGLTPARYRGALIGFAAAIKLTPLLFVAYFAMSRRLPDALRAVASFALCGLVAFALLPGESWTYWSQTVLTTSRIGDLASLGNQSVHGMLLRAGVPGSALPALWAALVLIICAVALIRARGLALAGHPAGAAVLVGCATVAASPVSWTHHQVWPVLAAMLLIGATGALQRVAGAAMMVAMVASMGVIMSRFPSTQGLQFLFENSRSLGVLAICVAGLGTAAALTKQAPSTLHQVPRTIWWRGTPSAPRAAWWRKADVSAPRRIWPRGALSSAPSRRIWLRGALSSAPSRRIWWRDAPSGASRWTWVRGAAAAAATLAFFAVLPLPAGADPTFKAYTAADVNNPRYFFVCHSYSACADMVRDVPVNFELFWEPTKVRVNGVVDATVARLEYKSAPGGAPRSVPLVELYPGQRGFSFRSANISNGSIIAYGTDGQPIAVYRDRLSSSYLPLSY